MSIASLYPDIDRLSTIHMTIYIILQSIGDTSVRSAVAVTTAISVVHVRVSRFQPTHILTV